MIGGAPECTGSQYQDLVEARLTIDAFLETLAHTLDDNTRDDQTVD